MFSWSKAPKYFIGGRTDASGQNHAELPDDFLRSLCFVTASKHNHAPALNYTRILTSSGYVSPASDVYTIDDDNSGTSSGNNNGMANPGESIELAIPLKKLGNIFSKQRWSRDDLTVVIPMSHRSRTTPSPTAPSMPEPRTRPPDDFDVALASYIPDGHILQLDLTVTDASQRCLQQRSQASPSQTVTMNTSFIS